MHVFPFAAKNGSREFRQEVSPAVSCRNLPDPQSFSRDSFSPVRHRRGIVLHVHGRVPSAEHDPARRGGPGAELVPECVPVYGHGGRDRDGGGACWSAVGEECRAGDLSGRSPWPGGCVFRCNDGAAFPLGDASRRLRDGGERGPLHRAADRLRSTQEPGDFPGRGAREPELPQLRRGGSRSGEHQALRPGAGAEHAPGLSRGRHPDERFPGALVRSTRVSAGSFPDVHCDALCLSADPVRGGERSERGRTAGGQSCHVVRPDVHPCGPASAGTVSRRSRDPRIAVPEMAVPDRGLDPRVRGGSSGQDRGVPERGEAVS